MQHTYNDIHKQVDWYSVDVESGMWLPVVRYHDDLNAMHEFEAKLIARGLIDAYIGELHNTTGYMGERGLAFATAEQRARAALAVLTVAQP